MSKFVLSDLNSQSNADYFTDYHMDLLRALEMSRLQFLREMGSLHPGTGERSAVQIFYIISTGIILFKFVIGVLLVS